jgi:DNA replication and repair protein RecF
MIGLVKLSDFRNFRTKSLEFSDKVTLIVGPNATGKTNILESLFLLSTGRSFKARVEEEMVNYEKDIARVSGVLSEKTGPVGSSSRSTFLADAAGAQRDSLRSRHPSLEVIITRGLIDIGAERPERVARKKLMINGVPKRMIDFAGNFKVVLFGPWDMDLVTETPSLRRKFLDTVISQVDREYRRSILSYEKGVRQRNRLLFRIREEGIARSQLSFWNQLLIKNGDYISQKREEFIEFVNSRPSPQTTVYSLVYDKSVISEGRLEQYKEEEVAAATTLVGPHRDDMQFKINNSKLKNERDLAAYGSRGEQRMGILWLKMAELDFIEAKSGERPTLLLDDIFSELDHEHRDIVMEITKNQQTIITTADEHTTVGLKKVEKIELKV